MVPKAFVLTVTMHPQPLIVVSDVGASRNWCLRKADLVNVSVSPAAQQELIDGAMFYAERADRELGLAFIAEFEHARGLLDNLAHCGTLGNQANMKSGWPESLSKHQSQPSLDIPLIGFLSYPYRVRMGGDRCFPRVLPRAKSLNAFGVRRRSRVLDTSVERQK